ncbi:hypothetical protein [Sphingomonas sp. C3-2]|uniref:hypothetical protein n=1 Tax=Sphingomonas sp. C3-2 TaxID=3062169 RepID=UPI00294B4F20|nr:hypothetical protein [Sphingomonas sp. C3-2]WOK35933.1 hypothetical protein QYC26_13105 [Sphingomonas sp. C3-2]
MAIASAGASGTAAHAEEAGAEDRGPFAGAARLDEAELDRMRGGFLLPNGLDIALGLEIATLVNGEVALRTVLTLDQGSAINVYTGGSAPASGDGPQVNLGSAEGPGSGLGAGVPVTPNGASINTPMGQISLEQGDRGSVVVLAGNALELRHMIGSITGAVVANTGNDRVIDTVVTVNLDMRNSDIPTTTSLVQLETMLVNAVGPGVR